MNNTFIAEHALGVNWDEIRKLINSYITQKDKKDLYDLAQMTTNNTSKDEITFSSTSIDENNELLLKLYKEYVNFLTNEGENIDENNILYNDYLIISRDSKLKEPKSIKDIFSNPNYKKLKFKPVKKQDNDINNRFTFINYNLEGLLKQDHQESIEIRIYLSPKVKYIGKVLEELIAIQQREKVCCIMKTCFKKEYNDRIILYISKENFEKYVKIANEVIKNHPEYFEEEIKNPLWGSLNDYDNIYYGEEPKQKGTSYGLSRAMALNDALSATLDYERLNNNTELTDEEFERFQKNFALYCLKYNINPNNICLNYSNNINLNIETDISLYIKDIDINTERFIIGYEFSEDLASTSPNIDNDMRLFFQKAELPKTEISISKDELIELYNGNENIKKSIIEKLNKKEIENIERQKEESKTIFLNKLNECITNPQSMSTIIEMMALGQRIILPTNSDEEELPLIKANNLEKEMCYLTSEYCSMLISERLLGQDLNTEKSDVLTKLREKVKIYQEYTTKKTPLSNNNNDYEMLTKTAENIAEEAIRLCAEYKIDLQDYETKTTSKKH